MTTVPFSPSLQRRRSFGTCSASLITWSNIKRLIDWIITAKTSLPRVRAIYGYFGRIRLLRCFTQGDAPGFVHVMDESCLVIPERPGNRRFDSSRNILTNPRVGIVFVIPGLKETLRVNGSAVLVRDEDILDRLSVQGKRPWLGIGVSVEECYMHCGKAFIRSQAWNPDSWTSGEQAPNPSKIITDHVNQDSVTEESVTWGLQDSYNKRLY